MSSAEVSFSAASDHSSIGNVRNALGSLHAKVAMLERDRDAHAQAASRARSDHEDYKMRMESEMNRERMIAAERERQLLEDVAAADAEIQHLKDRLRASNLHPLPERGLQTEADMEFEVRARQQMDSEKQRIEDAEHEVSKLEAERQVLESANTQLDQQIQHLLRTNEELLQMLRIAPRKGSPAANPAAARGAVKENASYNNNSSRGQLLTAGRKTQGPPPQQPPLRYRNSPVRNTNNNNNSRVNTSVQRETVSSRLRNNDNSANLATRRSSVPRTSSRDAAGASRFHRDPSALSTFERLAQPRSCSRNRPQSPPHSSSTHFGTNKDTARRFWTQELRSHSQSAVPH